MQGKGYGVFILSILFILSRFFGLKYRELRLNARRDTPKFSNNPIFMAIAVKFVLDCVASGTLWVDMEAMGVDVLISAPQKTRRYITARSSPPWACKPPPASPCNATNRRITALSASASSAWISCTTRIGPWPPWRQPWPGWLEPRPNSRGGH